MIKQFLGRLPKKPLKADNVGHDPSVSNPITRSTDSADLNAHENGVLHSDGLGPNENSESYVYEALPSFTEVPNSEKQNLFIKKLNLCCTVFDFTDPTKNQKDKDIKRQSLVELVGYMTSSNGKLADTSIQEAVKMVSANFFRPLWVQPHENKAAVAYDLEEEERAMDPAWPHLQLVYDFFLRFIVSSETDVKLAKRYIDHSFLLKLLELFNSEDHRERDYLKTILHRLYGKFMVLRPFIRKSINNILYHFMYETEKFNGVGELLEVLGSIINGLAVPLKEEHKVFLVRVLIPLHKPKCLPMYHQQLSFCIIQFVEKDEKLADAVIRGLLKYWPVTNTSKELMFLSELEEVLDGTQQPEFQRCMVPLFQRLARCIGSSHFQVAERALYLWNNSHIDNLIRQNRKVILPIIFPALEKNSHGHWNRVVQSLTVNVQKTFSSADHELFDDCLHKHQDDEVMKVQVKAKQEDAWRRLEEMVANNP